MINVIKLKASIASNGLTVNEVADKLGIDRSTFYRKLQHGGGSFTIDQARALGQILNLQFEDVTGIFFAH